MEGINIMDEKRLTVSVDECAVLLGISRGLCFQMVHEGKIPHLRFNKRILIPKWAIQRLLQEPEEAATSLHSNG